MDIEDKKQQLRQLVGNSYRCVDFAFAALASRLPLLTSCRGSGRDLIESADTILSMTTCCDSAVSHVIGIQARHLLLLAVLVSDRANSGLACYRKILQA